MSKLKIGDKAPSIMAKNHYGGAVSLKDYLGSKVILYFYPKDDTPGCTAEACNLRDNYKALLKMGYKIIGVSPDSQKTHVSFIAKNSLPFPLIADISKRVILDYGVWGTRNFAGSESEGVNRMTFVIDEKGFIEKIFEDVDTKNHTQQIIDAYKTETI